MPEHASLTFKTFAALKTKISENGQGHGYAFVLRQFGAMRRRL